MLAVLFRLICTAATALQLLIPSPDAPLDMLQAGTALRFHVVAHDDTARMQRIKLCVRDAVQRWYMQHPAPGSMLEKAEALLPGLTQAARDAAKAEGFDGAVSVTLGMEQFGERMLGSLCVPAGDYPALMIRLGDAQGRNWWGLLDPELSARWAATEDNWQDSSTLVWDWSLSGLLDAVRNCFAACFGEA